MHQIQNMTTISIFTFVRTPPNKQSPSVQSMFKSHQHLQINSHLFYNQCLNLIITYWIYIKYLWLKGTLTFFKQLSSSFFPILYYEYKLVFFARLLSNVLQGLMLSFGKILDFHAKILSLPLGNVKYLKIEKSNNFLFHHHQNKFQH